MMVSFSAGVPVPLEDSAGTTVIWYDAAAAGSSLDPYLNTAVIQAAQIEQRRRASERCSRADDQQTGDSVTPRVVST